VQSVKARIPWTKLTDKPVVVHVKGVALEIVPNPSYIPGTAHVRQPRTDASSSTAATDASSSASNSAGNSSNNNSHSHGPSDGPDGIAPADTDTYSGRVRQAVIDNIQIQISDIHVSFREPSSSASVMHFTIDSLRLHPIAANGSSASSVPPSPASSRSRSNSATISVDALFGGTLASAAMAAAAAACLHADCAAHPWPDLRRELALLERVLCRQLVLNNVCVLSKSRAMRSASRSGIASVASRPPPIRRRPTVRRRPTPICIVWCATSVCAPH
jgi:hypothetical protein